MDDFSKVVAVLVEDGQFLRMRKGQGIEKDAIHDGEDGGVRADTERQRENRDCSKPRRLRQRAQAVSQILPERLHRHTS